MGSSRQYNAEDEEACGEDDARSTSKLIDYEPKDEHARNLADEVRIRQAILDGRRDTMGMPDTTTNTT